jgi:hypothetical protein
LVPEVSADVEVGREKGEWFISRSDLKYVAEIREIPQMGTVCEIPTGIFAIDPSFLRHREHTAGFLRALDWRLCDPLIAYRLDIMFAELRMVLDVHCLEKFGAPSESRIRQMRLFPEQP